MKIDGGYYIKARRIQNSAISKAPPYIREIWDWLLMEANHSDAKYGGYSIKRGQLFRSYLDIREGLAWYVGWRKTMYCENHTKKAMKFLREHLMIASKKELGGVLITILNYETYQDPKNYERTSESTIERTIAEPLRNQPLPDSNKKKKNEKKNKKKEVGILSLKIFEIFLKKYPGTKRGIQTELDNFVKKHEDWRHILPTLEKSVDIQIEIERKLKLQRQSNKNIFVKQWKNCQTWLNNRSWEESVGVSLTTKKVVMCACGNVADGGICNNVPHCGNPKCLDKIMGR